MHTLVIGPIALVLAGTFVVGEPSLAQQAEDPFAASLVRSAVRQLNPKNDPETILSGLNALSLIGDTGGRDREAVDAALFESDALLALATLIENFDDDRMRSEAEKVHFLIAERVGLEDAVSAVPLPIVAERDERSWQTVELGYSGFVWATFEAESSTGYDLLVDSTDCEFRVFVLRVVQTDRIDLGYKVSYVTQGHVGGGSSIAVDDIDQAGDLLVRLGTSGDQRQFTYCWEQPVRLSVTRRISATMLTPATSREEAPLVEVGVTYRGEVGRQGQQWLRFQCVDGEEYDIATTSIGVFDSVLVLSEGDDVLAADDDGGGGLASRIVWSCESDTEYFIQVTEFDGGAFSFNISITRLDRAD